MLQNAAIESSDADIASNIRHKIMQPTAAMKLLLESIEKPRSEDRQKRIVGALTKATGELEGVLSKLLDYHFLCARAVEVEHHEFSVLEFVQQQIAHCSKATGATISLEFSLPVGELVTTDQRLLSKAVAAILENAVLFGEDGNISVKVCKENAGLKLSVANTSDKFRAEDFEKALKPFQICEHRGKSAETAIGLGLPIAVEAVSLLGGELEFEKRGAGSVIEVSIRLPLHP